MSVINIQQNKNLAVITLREVFKNDVPILYVFHDLDGDFQFMPEVEELKMKDAYVVSLSQMFNLDNTLIKIVSILESGYRAERKFVGSEWTISKIEDEEESN